MNVCIDVLRKACVCDRGRDKDINPVEMSPEGGRESGRETERERC